ncbi:hypothetical protein HUJ05_007695 [Dendroctonus ponderosae]|nr:hypothetical protein HUJ05_007695 [Dendroctonus ponderosae]
MLPAITKPEVRRESFPASHNLKQSAAISNGGKRIIGNIPICISAIYCNLPPIVRSSIVRPAIFRAVNDIGEKFSMELRFEKPMING